MCGAELAHPWSWHFQAKIPQCPNLLGMGVQITPAAESDTSVKNWENPGRAPTTPPPAGFPGIPVQLKAFFLPFAGKSFCEGKPEVHRQRGDVQGVPGHPQVLHVPEDDLGGAGGVLQQAGHVWNRQTQPRGHHRGGAAPTPVLKPVRGAGLGKSELQRQE